MVPMMGVSADSREDPAPRRRFLCPERRGWRLGSRHCTRGFEATGQSPRLSPCWTCGLSLWERPIFPSCSRAYAAAWNEGAKALESGQPVTAALKSVRESWDSGQVQLFDRLVTPEFSKFVVGDGGFFRALIPVVVGEGPGVGGCAGLGGAVHRTLTLRTSRKPRPSQPTWQPWPGPDAVLLLA